MMPLSLANAGETNIIKKIGGKPEVKKHLENLGFVVGGNVQVVSTLGGNVIVNVKEARVAISEEMARKIMTTNLIQYIIAPLLRGEKWNFCLPVQPRKPGYFPLSP